MVTRFAPSPTGFLHLGHIASAVYVWGLGRAFGARILLRIEDHDTGRCRPEFERAIFEDLAWLGFRHDNNELRFGAPSAFRQSDRTDAYRNHLASLNKQNLIYACTCSRKSLAAHAANPAATQGETGELRYPGICRELCLPLDTLEAGIRLRLPRETVAFVDGGIGAVTQTPADQCGDLLLRDRQEQFTYQFAVVADDLEQGVNLIVRGQDLTASTGRQIQLGRMLGRSRDAAFWHHPLIVDDAGRKLGKRFFSEAIAKRRADGERPEDLLGEAAHLVGLIPKPIPVAPTDLPSLFSGVKPAPEWSCPS